MADVLTTLFGSKEKARIMRFFILNPGSKFTLKDVREKTRLEADRVRKAVTMLTKLGLLKEDVARRQKVYGVDEQFPYYNELRNLFVKSNVYPHCSEVQNMKKLGSLQLVAISGVFMNYPHAEIDLLVVGNNVKRPALNEKIARIEAEIGHEVRYSTMSTEDFLYRLEMMDRFIIDFMTGPHDMIINKVPEKTEFLINLQKKKK